MVTLITQELGYVKLGKVLGEGDNERGEMKFP